VNFNDTDMAHSIDIPPSKVLLIDDHALVAEGIKGLLLRILAPSSTVDLFFSLEKAKQHLQTNKYRYIITDLIIPGQNVMKFISECRKNFSDVIIIVLSGVNDAKSIKECLTAGANGYLSKATELREIQLALEYTYKGKKFISSDLSGTLADSIISIENTSLTPKELEIVRLVAKGCNTKKMAELIFVSPLTITSHKRNILRKLNLHSATELVKYAYDNHLV
jgi:DNA-binding NarL/FixJ family response regulator